MNSIIRKNSATTANFFMLFLLSYNVLMGYAMSQLYWNAPEGGFFKMWFSSPWFMVANQIMGLVVPLLIFRSFMPAISVPKRRLGSVNIMIVTVLSVLMQPAMMLLSGIASLIIPNPVPDVLSELAAMPIPAGLIVIALTPAICEELIFRGYIQKLYEKQPIVVSALVNGLFFGMIHLNMHQFTYAFAMGIVFVYLVYITKSIYAAVLSHFISNALQFLLSRWAATQTLQQTEEEALAAEAITMIEVIQQVGLLFVLTLPFTIMLFMSLIKYNKPIKVDNDENEIEPLPFDKYFIATVILFIILIVAVSSVT